MDKVNTLTDDRIIIMVIYSIILDELIASTRQTFTFFPLFFPGFLIQDTLEASLFQNLPDHFTVGRVLGEDVG